MTKAVTYSKTGSKQESPTTLNSAIFEVKANHELMSMAYRSYEAGLRMAHASTLTKGEVRGGGKKPWRQKGTGKARAGSSRLPHWTGGGVAFGPTGSQNHTLNMTQKAKQLALRQALSTQAEQGRLSVIEEFHINDGRTKSATALLSKLKQTGRGLLVIAKTNQPTSRATANIAGLATVTARHLSTHAVLTADWIIVTKPALDVLDECLASDRSKAANSKTVGKTREAGK